MRGARIILARIKEVYSRFSLVAAFAATLHNNLTLSKFILIPLGWLVSMDCNIYHLESIAIDKSKKIQKNTGEGKDKRDARNHQESPRRPRV